MKKTLLIFLPILAMSTLADSSVLVKDITARQRYPWNGLVDVVVTIQGGAEDVANAGCSFVAANSATMTALPVAHITRNGDDVETDGGWVRKFIWDAKTDVGAVKIDDVALTVDVEIPLGGVQLWENGPYWAECNVGASQPEESGYYFWWGDTVGYKRNSENTGWVSVKDDSSFSFSSGNCPTYGKNNSQLQSDGYIDSTGNLVAAHDTATAHLGAPWRMPTDAEFSALINNCDTEWTSRNGVSGRLVKGRGAYASKSIFLPAAGDGGASNLGGLGSSGLYWSSTPNSDDSDFAWRLYFRSGYFYRSDSSRSLGRSVRPVRGFADAAGAHTDTGVTTHLSLDTTHPRKDFSYDGSIYTFWKYKSEEVELYEGIDFGGPLPWGDVMDSQAAIPVTVRDGALERADVDLRLIGTSHIGELGEIKIYDDATFMKMVVPTVNSREWEDWWDEWGYENDTTCWCWPKDVWPEKQAKSGRYWILAPIMAEQGNAYGLTHLEVSVSDDTHEAAQKGVSYCYRSQISNLPFHQIFGGSTCVLPNLLSDKWWWFHPFCVAPTDGHNGQWFDLCYATDGAKIEVATKSAGTLIFTYWTDGDEYSIRPTGNKIIDYTNSFGEESSLYPYEVWESEQILKVQVSAATTITLASDEWSDLYVKDVAFYPADAKSVNLKTEFFEDCDFGDGCEEKYLRGYVTGGGVYKAGETATLVAVAGDEAIFDHWEIPNGVEPGSDVTEPTLRFVVPTEICGTASEQRIVEIRPIWKDSKPVTPTVKFDGAMYGCWWGEDGESEIWGYYGDYGVDPESADWADDFVDVKGSKEPGTWCGYAFPVAITPGTTFTPQIVKASTDAEFATVSVKTDAEMLAMMSKFTDEDGAWWWVGQIWPNGQTDSSRAWAVVFVIDVPKGDDCYTFDLTTKLIADGSKSIKAYAQQYGATLPDTLEIPKSISFKIGIKETGEVFSERLWAIYDPWNIAQYRAAIDKVDDNGGDSEMFDSVGLWFVTQEMIDEQQGAGVVKITFNANGGTCATTSKSYETGAAVGELPTATRSGYTFKGWFTAASGGTQVTATTVVTGDMTLYAHWAVTVALSAVEAQQRDDGLVDIAVTLRGTAEDVAEYDCVFAATNSATKAAIPVEYITQNGDDTGSGTTWTRKFVWDAKADVGAVKIDDIALAVDIKIPLGGVQLWENGPYWAECNVGATKPEECGYYFWWGDTVGYKRNSANNGWVSVKDETSFSFSSGNCPTRGKSNSLLQSEGYIDATGNLVAAHDAATAHLGAPWRMPTGEEFLVLISSCTTTWTTRNGVNGRLVTGKGAYASKSIFLPAAGNSDDSHLYNLGSRGSDWSSTPYSDNPGRACDLVFGSDDVNRDYDSRCDGQTVRPVRGFASIESEGVGTSAVTTHFAYVPPADDVTRFEGGLYGIENSPQDCEDPHGDERYIEHMYSGEDYAGYWQKYYVEIDGRKEPAAFRDNRRFGFAIPVLVASGGTVTPEIVHLTSNGTYFHQIEVLSDEEFRTWDRHEGVSIPSPDTNRCWVIVLHNEQPNVKPDSNQRYRFDITKMSAANGKDMMEWTHEHGEEFPEAISLPESVSYAIRIKETGEVFPKRFWNVYNPMYDELYDAFDGDDYDYEYHNGQGDYLECPGLWLVTQEMIDEQREDVTPVVSAITYANLHGAAHANPETYQEGTEVNFTPPSGRTGYTFTGWTPAAITADMTGAQTVTAGWRANAYQIAYYANGGSGTMTTTDCEYDKEGEIAANDFVRTGYVFNGWATEEKGGVVYRPGDKVTNLTAADGGTVTLYAVWEKLEPPVVSPPDGFVFMANTCEVSIGCATEGATIYYSTTAVPRVLDRYVYSAPFVISDTTKVYAFSRKDGQQSATVTATITKKTLTLAEAAGAADLSFTTGGLAVWSPAADATTATGFSARSGTMPAAESGTNESWMELTVSGAGTLTFNWRVDCEDDGPGTATWDHLAYSVDGEEIDSVDGLTDWEEVTVSFEEDGSHTVRWTYVKDDYDEPMDIEDCGWVEGIVWTPSAAPSEIIAEDPNGKIKVPQGADVEKLDIKVMSHGHDIRPFLDLPAVQNGEIDLAQAMVKEEYIKEAMDPAKGAEIRLNAADPVITTAPTKLGLVYSFREGTTLEGFGDKTPSATKIGDGTKWTPPIKVKGGNAAFYSIGVGKGE